MLVTQSRIVWLVLAVVACGPPPEGRDAGVGGGSAGGAAGGAAGGSGGAGTGGGAGGAGGGGTAGGAAGGVAGGAGGGSAGGLGGGTGGADAGRDGGVPDAGPLDAGMLVEVGHTREFRGLWVSTVTNLDFPLAAAKQRDAGTAELGIIVDTAATHGFNALVFQVRPESDALYNSNREPWSRFASGTQGVSPGWDPLATLIPMAHQRGIEVHAWMNPFRGLMNPTVNAAPNHITRVLPQHAITFNNGVTMDPSAPAVRSWIANVVGDIVSNYDVDGIHYDDYLYPYGSSSNPPFPDDPQYQAYQADGGTMTKYEWRRSNINAMIQLTAQTAAALKPWVRFGTSPFGIYKPGVPPGITGLNSYDDIASDPPYWLRMGWVDYVAPQLYWTTNMTGQQFGLLIDWWSQQAGGNGRYVFTGHALFKVGSSTSWSIQEFKDQVQLTRAAGPAGSGGIWFRNQMLRDDLGGMQAVFKTDLYPTPALPPPLATQRMNVVPVPTVMKSGSALMLGHPAPSTLRGYTLYKLVGGLFVLDRFVPGGSAAVTPGNGAWAIAAVDRSDVESRGVVAIIP
jgi:uncharacterized lipoprotein YddW (UPF0748 family)